MGIQMEALRTFTGVEGFQRKGSVFEVIDYDRAVQLSEHGLAKMVGNQETITSDPDSTSSLENGEVWGIKSLGGGWYGLPNGKRVQGFEKAQKSLLETLQSEVQPKETDDPIPDQEEVRLIPPIVNQVVKPKIIWTGEPEEIGLSSFDVEVKYLEDGWYELPNGERIQGKETARDVYEAYIREQGGS